MNKIRSTNTYFHEYPDGSGIKTQCYINDNHVSWHTKQAKALPDSQLLEVQVQKYSVDSVIDTPIGGIQSVSTKEKKEFEMTVKQYREFVVKFWENGPDYYDII